jgi:hypothetical protein
VNHKQAKSLSVCPTCGVGFCQECENRIRNVPVCPQCEGLCVEASAFEQKQRLQKQRERTFAEDLGFILSYPFTDPWAYGMLAVFAWAFGFVQPAISLGLLIGYSFSAVLRVSSGRTDGYMPNFSDFGDVANAGRLAFGAFLASSWPLLLVMFLAPQAALVKAEGPALDVVHAQEAEGPVAEEEDPEEESEDESPESGATPAPSYSGLEDESGEESVPVHLSLLWVLAMLWRFLYTPMALIAAAISQSFLKTLNPLIGIESIHKMGSDYWKAVAIYSVLVTIQWFAHLGLDLVPIAGSLVASFIDAWVMVASGCALGIAVFKRAAALGLD